MEITRDIAAKVLKIVDAGLVNGIGKPVPGQMCVEAAVCYALGLDHGDDPGCVSPALRSLKIKLNDSEWSSPSVRAAGMRRLAVAQLGSAGVLDEVEFVRRVSKHAIGVVLPKALRIVAPLVGKDHGDRLLEAAGRCERDRNKAAADLAHFAASYAASYAAIAASYAAIAASYAAAAAATTTAAAARSTTATARSTAAAAARSTAAAAIAASYASYAADAATTAATAAYATRAASYAASYAAAATTTATAAYATRAAIIDETLSWYSEEVVQILVDMKAPGCDFLDLTTI